jgi:hypothetical protein
VLTAICLNHRRVVCRLTLNLQVTGNAHIEGKGMTHDNEESTGKLTSSPILDRRVVEILFEAKGTGGIYFQQENKIMTRDFAGKI